MPIEIAPLPQTLSGPLRWVDVVGSLTAAAMTPTRGRARRAIWVEAWLTVTVPLETELVCMSGWTLATKVSPFAKDTLTLRAVVVSQLAVKLSLSPLYVE